MCFWKPTPFPIQRFLTNRINRTNSFDCSSFFHVCYPMSLVLCGLIAAVLIHGSYAFNAFRMSFTPCRRPWYQKISKLSYFSGKSGHDPNRSDSDSGLPFSEDMGESGGQSESGFTLEDLRQGSQGLLQEILDRDIMYSDKKPQFCKPVVRPERNYRKKNRSRNPVKFGLW